MVRHKEVNELNSKVPQPVRGRALTGKQVILSAEPEFLTPNSTGTDRDHQLISCCFYLALTQCEMKWYNLPSLKYLTDTFPSYLGT